jgi:hypothetical protein
LDVGECAGGFEAAAAYVRDEPAPRGDTGCHGGRHGLKLEGVMEVWKRAERRNEGSLSSRAERGILSAVIEAG